MAATNDNATRVRAAVSTEVGFSGRSGPHVIVGYADAKPATACGTVLSGLADNHWVEPGDLFPTGICPRCLRAVGAAGGTRPGADRG